MTQKIRKQFPINLEKRNDVTKERINKWLDAQGNYTISVVSIIEHMIDRFGYVDVMDHDVIKQLHNELFLYKQNVYANSPQFNNSEHITSNSSNNVSDTLPLENNETNNSDIENDEVNVPIHEVTDTNILNEKVTEDNSNSNQENSKKTIPTDRLPQNVDINSF